MFFLTKFCKICGKDVKTLSREEYFDSLKAETERTIKNIKGMKQLDKKERKARIKQVSEAQENLIETIRKASSEDSTFCALCKSEIKD